MSAQFPRNYDVPSGGTLVRRTILDHDQLRILRTELELLRRIARLTDPRRLSDIPLSEGKYTDKDRKELRAILPDAQHPAVQE